METLIPILIPATYFGFVLVERRWPARPQPAVRLWAVRGILLWIASGAIMTAVSGAVTAALTGHALIELSRAGTAVSILGVLVISDAIGYVWHRARHRVTPLWRIHQMHHSAERIDALGAFYFHPLDTVAVGILFGGVATLLGVSPEVAALTSYVGYLMAVFQHSNLRTPRWLGYLVQRPESHSIHHERGVHAFNYADFPIFDLLFGTFRNPATWTGKAGFWDGASTRLGPLLLLADVTRPPAASDIPDTRHDERVAA